MDVCVHHIWAWCLWRSEEGVESSGTRIANGYNHPVHAGNQPGSYKEQLLLTFEPLFLYSPSLFWYMSPYIQYIVDVKPSVYFKEMCISYVFYYNISYLLLNWIMPSLICLQFKQLTCKYSMKYRDINDLFKLKILTWEDCPRSSRYLSFAIRICIRFRYSP